MSRYLFCTKCEHRFDLEDHLPIIVACENDLCLKCVQSSNFLVNDCQLCKMNHVKSSKEYILSFPIIRFLKDINNEKKQLEEGKKKKLDIFRQKLTTSLSKFDSIKAAKLSLFSKHQSETEQRFEFILKTIKELKNKYDEDYEKSIANVNSYFNDSSIILDSKQALESIFKEIETDVGENVNLIEMFDRNLKKYNELIKDLDLNTDCLFETFQKKHEQYFGREFLADIESNFIKDQENRIKINQNNDVIFYEPSDIFKLNKNFYQLNRELYFDFCENKYDSNFTIFRILDENMNSVHNIDMSFPISTLKLIGKSITKEAFTVFFSNHKPNEYLIIKYSNEKLSHKIINTTRKLLNVNSNSSWVFSTRKKAIFGLDQLFEKEFEIKEMNDLPLNQHDFDLIGSNQDNVFLIQDKKIKIIHKRTNAFTSVIDLQEETSDEYDSSNFIIRTNLDNNIVIINKATSQIKLIDSNNGNILKKQTLYIPNNFSDVQITFNNEIAFIYYEPEISIKFL